MSESTSPAPAPPAAVAKPTALDLPGLKARGKRRIKEVRLQPREEYPHGATVLIRTLTEPEHIAFSALIRQTLGEKAEDDSYRRFFLAWVLCDEQGRRIVADDQVDALRELDAGDAMTIYEAAREFVGFNHKEEEKARKN